LVFAFVPMQLAIFIMHPQFDLMHPLVQSGQLPSSGLFGLSGGMHEPLSIVVGHLIWGSVLGLLYTRPVGYPANQLPALPPAWRFILLCQLAPCSGRAPVHVRDRDRVQLSHS
jgi:hypothetical protein